MHNKEITTIDQLKEKMIQESATFSRQESVEDSANGKGIVAQWIKSTDYPAMVYAMIWSDAAIDVTDTTVQEGFFEMASFWFDEKGDRVERPGKADELVDSSD